MRLIKSFRAVLLLLLLLLLFAAGCIGLDSNIKPDSPQGQPAEMEEADPETCPTEITPGDELLTVHFIDVGQGDACLIELPSGQRMLIDGGEKATAKNLKDYLREQGVDRIDHLIATHPHADHIGGLIGIVEDFSIGKIYMPRVAHNTNTYLQLLEAIKSKGLKITTAKGGLDLQLGEGIEAKFIAPSSDNYDDLNDYSVVLMLTHGQVSFLFTGDAEVQSEVEMLENEKELKAQVLKIGHHGSSTSSSKEFLEAVDPHLAVISVGKENSYGHPHKEVTERLHGVGAEVLRTDQIGTIIITSDGQEIVEVATPVNPLDSV